MTENVDKNPPSRWFCFTINNPTIADDAELTSLAAQSVYLCYAQEHFEDPLLTPHYQGYVELSKPQRFTWLRGIITRAHIEPRRGSRTQARDYCFKECSEPIEHGTWQADRQGQRNDLVTVQRELDMNVPMVTIAQNHFGTWVRNRNSFSAYLNLIRPARRDWKTKVIVFYGPPGTGKTRLVYHKCPDVHDMHYENGFWSPYNQQENVLIDDFDDTIMSRNSFLKLTDRYPMKLRILHGWAEWVPRTIYITSNYSPTEWYGGDPAILRRIDSSLHTIGNEGYSEKRRLWNDI